MPLTVLLLFLMLLRQGQTQLTGSSAIPAGPSQFVHLGVLSWTLLIGGLQLVC